MSNSNNQLFPESIPAEMKAKDRWILYRQEQIPGKEKPTKRPCSAKTRGFASTDKPETWCKFDEALDVYRGGGFDGLGFVFNGDGIAGIDLDNCRDPETGEVAEWAEDIIFCCDSYTEFSPSKTGFHIILKADHKFGGKRGDLEAYTFGRYFTVTGNVYHGSEIEDRSEEFKKICEDIRPTVEEPTAKGPPAIDKSDLTEADLALCSLLIPNEDRFRKLFSGAIDDYPSHSEADLALCVLLAQETRDPQQIDRIFRQSGLYRDKWDSRRGDSTYGSQTILKALAGDDSYEEGGDVKRSLSGLVIEEVLKHVTLLHDSDGTAYAAVTEDGVRQLLGLESKQFSNWLGYFCYREFKNVLNRNNFNDIKNTLTGKAVFEGREVAVHLRTAHVDGKYYLDLCRPDWSVIEVTADGWSNVGTPPDVFFRRNSSMRELPEPVNSSYQELPFLLESHFNMTPDDIKLLIAFMVECLMPNTEYPILEITGSPGSGKSTIQEMVREIIDPSKVNLRAAPAGVDDVFVGAGNNHLVSYNNLSKISKGMSDALCSLSTGGGHAGRRFYTNEDEFAFDIQRPVVLNGIATLAKQTDLIDRLIRICLEPIPSDKNMAKKEVMDSFNESLPRILGSLLDCFAHSLRMLPTVKLERLPRMADFARMCQALTEVYGWDPGVLDCYYDNRASSFEETLDSSPAVQAVVRHVQRNGVFEGTVKQLFDVISGSSTENWVKTPRGLAEKLRIHTPALKAVGVQVWFDPTRHNDGYHIRVVHQHVQKQSSQPSQSSRKGVTASQKQEQHREYREHREHKKTTSQNI